MKVRTGSLSSLTNAKDVKKTHLATEGTHNFHFIGLEMSLSPEQEHRGKADLG